MTATLRKSLLATALLAAACGAHAVTINDGLDGTWLNPAEADSGRGVSLDVVPQADGSAIVFGGVFSYDADGNPTWLSFSETFAAGQTSSDGVALLRNTGGSFGSPYSVPTTEQVGTASISIDSCTSMILDLTLDADAGLDDVALDLIPSQLAATGASNALCNDVPMATACPAGTTADGDDCTLPNSITGAIFLPAGKVYTIRGEVAVENGATLTIAPGVTVRGSEDTSALNYLVVKRGGRIYAEGTAAQPITFTGPDATIGSWGGLVLAGNSTCNDGAEATPCQFEANPAITYGGSDLNDSSGALRYVRVQYAGIAISEDSEFNSITLLGVGAGTVLDHVQVDSGKDDGFEMFGGSVNGRYLVCSNMGDDCFDFDQGYTGKIQFALALQGENTDLGDDSNGIESDNDGDNNDKLPRTQPRISNMTLVGKPELTRHGMRLRRGTGGNYSSLVVTGYTEECLELGDAGTFAQGTADAQGDTLSMTHTFIGTCTAGQFKDDQGDAYPVSEWFAAGEGNESGGAAMLDGFLPQAGSPVLEGGKSHDDAFFRPTTYRGAFAAGENWTAGWTMNLGN